MNWPMRTIKPVGVGVDHVFKRNIVPVYVETGLLPRKVVGARPAPQSRVTHALSTTESATAAPGPGEDEMSDGIAVGPQGYGSESSAEPMRSPPVHTDTSQVAASTNPVFRTCTNVRSSYRSRNRGISAAMLVALVGLPLVGLAAEHHTHARPTTIGGATASPVARSAASTPAIRGAAQITLPPPTGNASRTRPLNLVLIEDPKLTSTDRAQLNQALPVDIAYFDRWRFMGDTIASPTLPEHQTNTPVSPSQLFDPSTETSDATLVREAEATWASSPAADRALVVITSNPSAWAPLMPTSPSSVFHANGNRRGPVTRSYLLVPGEAPGPLGLYGPYPRAEGAGSSTASTARSVARIWVNGIGAIWRG